MLVSPIIRLAKIFSLYFLQPHFNCRAIRGRAPFYYVFKHRVDYILSLENIIIILNIFKIINLFH